MALRIHPPFTHFSNSPMTLFTHKLKTRISCSSSNSSNGISDAALASEFAAKATRINTHLVQAEEAMKKSRQLLFGEFCEYLGLKEDDAKQKWSKMDDDEKWVLVKGFLADWGANFHPLSARSTKEMVEEYLRQGNPPATATATAKSSPSISFPGLKRIIGF